MREEGISRYDLGREGFLKKHGLGKKNMLRLFVLNGKS